MSLSAVWVVPGWGAGVVGAAVTAVVEAGAGRESAGPAGNMTQWVLRCNQLNHNWSSRCLRVREQGKDTQDRHLKICRLSFKHEQ